MREWLHNAKETLQRVRRPLAVVILPFLGGLCAGYRSPALLLSVALLLVGVAVSVSRRDRGWRFFVWLVVSGWVAGGIWGMGDLALRQHACTRALAAGKKGRFICQVGERVRFLRKTTRGVSYTFTAEAFLTEAGRPVARRIPVEVTWYDNHPAYGGRRPVPGERWVIDGTLRQGRDRHRLPVLRGAPHDAVGRFFLCSDMACKRLVYRVFCSLRKKNEKM